MKKKKKLINKISKFFVIISFFILVIFYIYIFRLNVIPLKYLSILFSVMFFFYLIFYLFLLIKNVKKSFKIFSMVMLTFFSILCCFGITYADATTNFFQKINNELLQKEEYYVVVLNESVYQDISELRDLKIGSYITDSTTNTEKAITKLKEQISFEDISYDNIALLFEDLRDQDIDAVLINGSIYNLINSGELDYLNFTVRTISTLEIEIENIDVVKIVDVTTTPFNIYVAGGDAYGSIDKITNTDVNMVISVNPKNHQILLTSIPRDYYVSLSNLESDAYDKLTHAGYYGIETSIKSVEELLDIEINYYIKVNFSTIETLINTIGGVTVYSDYAFTASDSTYSYVYGNNYMDGAKALRFARERKAFSNGDVQRVKNQQKVLTAIINKFTSSTTLITKYTSILSAISNTFSTNLDDKSISRLIKFQLNDMTSWDIETQNLIGTDLFTEETYTFPNVRLYVMLPDEESVNETSLKIKEFINGN